MRSALERARACICVCRTSNGIHADCTAGCVALCSLLHGRCESLVLEHDSQYLSGILCVCVCVPCDRTCFDYCCYTGGAHCFGLTGVKKSCALPACDRTPSLGHLSKLATMKINVMHRTAWLIWEHKAQKSGPKKSKRFKCKNQWERAWVARSVEFIADIYCSNRNGRHRIRLRCCHAYLHAKSAVHALDESRSSSIGSRRQKGWPDNESICVLTLFL